MQAIYDLRDMLCDELEEYGKKGEVTSSTLEYIDKIAHAVKNIDKILEKEEGSSGYDGMHSGTRPSYRGGNSYGNSYARRDSRGRYRSSYDNGLMADLRQMMEDEPDERKRSKIRAFLSEMGQ